MKKIKTLLYIVSGFFVLGFFQNCGYVGQSAPEKFMSSQSSFSAVPTYAELYSNIFQSKCKDCHLSGTLNFTSYNTLMAGGTVVPYSASSSPFYLRVAAGDMPQGGPVLSAAEQAAIRNWIQAGAMETDSAQPIPVPDAPTVFSAIASSSNSSLLQWDLPEQVVTTVKILRATNTSGPFAVVATLTGSATSYSDSGLSPVANYSYKINFTNTSGTSPDSNVVTITTPAPVPPIAPSNLIASAVSTNQINLSWTDNSNNETGFKVEQASANNGPYTLIYTTGANATTYSVMGLSTATKYYFRVIARNVAGDSASSSVANATTHANATTIPIAPTVFTATAISSTQINLAWMDNSNNETGFKIERSASVSGPFVTLTTVGTNVTSYQNTGLTASTSYFYRISSVNAAGSSSPTSVVSATTTATTNANATFTWINANVLSTNSAGKCLMCHGSGGAAGYDFRTYAGVMKGVKANNSTGSIFYTSIKSGSMPQGSSTLPTATVNNIKAWIDSGALNN